MYAHFLEWPGCQKDTPECDSKLGGTLSAWRSNTLTVTKEYVNSNSSISTAQKGAPSEGKESKKEETEEGVSEEKGETKKSNFIEGGEVEEEEEFVTIQGAQGGDYSLEIKNRPTVLSKTNILNQMVAIYYEDFGESGNEDGENSYGAGWYLGCIIEFVGFLLFCP